MRETERQERKEHSLLIWGEKVVFGFFLFFFYKVGQIHDCKVLNT